MQGKRVPSPVGFRAKTRSLGWVIQCLLVSLAVDGCARQDFCSGGARSSPISARTAQAGQVGDVVSGGMGTGPARAETGTCSGDVQMKSAVRAPGLVDHVEGGSPPELLAEATEALEGRLVCVWPIDVGSTRLFDVDTDQGDCGIFLEKEGRFIRVNRGPELIAINEALEKVRFTRYHFDNSGMVYELLWQVISRYMYNSSVRFLPSCDPLMLRPAYWLHGTERDEAVFRDLSREPEFTFTGNRWTTAVNVFKSDGSVDSVRVTGKHDPTANVNTILRVSVTPLRPAGTFSFPGGVWRRASSVFGREKK
jgi:hypothetical protein